MYLPDSDRIAVCAPCCEHWCGDGKLRQEPSDCQMRCGVHDRHRLRKGSCHWVGILQFLSFISLLGAMGGVERLHVFNSNLISVSAWFLWFTVYFDVAAFLARI